MSEALGDRQTEGPRRTPGSRSPPAPRWAKGGAKQGQVRPPHSALAVWGLLASNKLQSSRKAGETKQKRGLSDPSLPVFYLCRGSSKKPASK